MVFHWPYDLTMIKYPTLLVCVFKKISLKLYKSNSRVVNNTYELYCNNQYQYPDMKV